MKKRILSFAVILSMLMFAVPSASADESWREAFVTRIMKEMSTAPQYNEIALTDLDRNGIPEAFLYKNSADGGIGSAFTLSGSQITTISVPSNIIGSCLSDIEVYLKDGRYIFVGKEVPRYTSVIRYYKLKLENNALTVTKILKEDVSPHQAIQYVDIHGSNFLTNGYPNRNKIRDFIDSYEKVNTLSATKSKANLTVNGKKYDILGYSIENSNYYKIRDIAMLVRTTPARFAVDWDQNLNAISLSTGIKYTPIGSELTDDTSTTLSISKTIAPIYVDGEKTNVVTYTINDSTYIKIRDLGDMVGFLVGWNSETQTVEITAE